MTFPNGLLVYYGVTPLARDHRQVWPCDMCLFNATYYVSTGPHFQKIIAEQQKEGRVPEELHLVLTFSNWW